MLAQAEQLFRAHALAVPALLVVLGGGPLLAAAYVEYGMGLAPCTLCWWQRYPYWGILTAGSALLAYAQWLSPRCRAIALGATALTLLGGAGVAGFHVGVEQRWWEGLATCGGGNIGEGSLEDQLAAIMTAPVARCDEVAWSLFGLSMAGYNLILSVGLAVACLVLAAALWRPAGSTIEGEPA